MANIILNTDAMRGLAKDLWPLVAEMSAIRSDLARGWAGTQLVPAQVAVLKELSDQLTDLIGSGDLSLAGRIDASRRWLALDATTIDALEGRGGEAFDLAAGTTVGAALTASGVLPWPSSKGSTRLSDRLLELRNIVAAEHAGVGATSVSALAVTRAGEALGGQAARIALGEAVPTPPHLAEYNTPAGNWCGSFVHWVLAQSGHDLPGNWSTVSTWVTAAQNHQNGLSIVADHSKVSAGDLIVYNFPGGVAWDHIGMVTGGTFPNLSTVQGNWTPANPPSSVWAVDSAGSTSIRAAMQNNDFIIIHVGG